MTPQGGPLRCQWWHVHDSIRPSRLHRARPENVFCLCSKKVAAESEGMHFAFPAWAPYVDSFQRVFFSFSVSLFPSCGPPSTKSWICVCNSLVVGSQCGQETMPMGLMFGLKRCLQILGSMSNLREVFDWWHSKDYKSSSQYICHRRGKNPSQSKALERKRAGGCGKGEKYHFGANNHRFGHITVSSTSWHTDKWSTLPRPQKGCKPQDSWLQIHGKTANKDLSLDFWRKQCADGGKITRRIVIWWLLHGKAGAPTAPWDEPKIMLVWTPTHFCTNDW